MRLLTEAEMDQVFGGQDSSNVTTLPTITVTAPRQNSGGGYWIGGWSDFGQDEYYGSGGSSSCYYTSSYQPLPSPSVPTPEGLRCAMTAAAVPGFDLPAGVDIHMVNSHGFRELTPGVPNFNEIVLQNSSTAPGNYEGPMYGSYNGNNIYMYAAGMMADAGSGSYVDVTTGATMPGIGPLTARENQILTMAHEAAHIVLGNPGDEAIMEGYGVAAVQNFRNGAGANCPN